MITAFISAGFVLLALVFLVRLGRSRRRFDSETLQTRLRPVDVQAFRNLTDPEEEDYLKAVLPPAKFRKVQRRRLRAALDYVFCTSQNAGVLVRMGDAARRSNDPSVVQAGERLVDSALRLRLYALRATGKLYVGMALPGVQISSVGLAETYELMARQGAVLGRLQYPAQRISALL